jgi:Fic family protein
VQLSGRGTLLEAFQVRAPALPEFRKAWLRLQETHIVIYFAEPIEADVLRIRHEFLEAPGLRLSAATAAHRLGVSLAHASDMLNELEQAGFLMRIGDGVYRGTEPSMA